MKKILIFGNSGAGKSTLAKELCETQGLVHLDLDTLAWLPVSPPKRKSLTESALEISLFIKSHAEWVIEGCYSDLLELVVKDSSELIFMDLSVQACVENAKNRPWEPHKYESKTAQDSNLAMLIDWIEQYTEREDTFSKRAHQELYIAYNGKKKIVTSNKQIS